MPRVARVKNETAIYHIMVRGNNRQEIFLDDDDRLRYLSTLKRYKEKYQIEVYAYCMMTNHVHLMIDCKGQDISKVMQGLSLSYTIYFNKKYGRCGHLFQDRFKSVIVEDDCYMIELTKYIHLNPGRANMIEKSEEYRWSSYPNYMGTKDIRGIINIAPILNYFSNDINRAIKLYDEYMLDESFDIEVSILQDVYENTDRCVNTAVHDIKDVLTATANHFNVCVHDLLKKGTKRFAKIRQLAAYLVSIKCKISYEEIAKKFEQCPSGVGHNITKAIDKVISDVQLRNDFIYLSESLG